MKIPPKGQVFVGYKEEIERTLKMFRLAVLGNINISFRAVSEM